MDLGVNKPKVAKNIWVISQYSNQKGELNGKDRKEFLQRFQREYTWFRFTVYRILKTHLDGHVGDIYALQ